MELLIIIVLVCIFPVLIPIFIGLWAACHVIGWFLESALESPKK